MLPMLLASAGIELDAVLAMTQQELEMDPTIASETEDVGISRVDMRTLLPETGLREYWYPGLLAKDIKKKPVLLRILDKEVCFFQGKSGIAAVDNACAHRGGMLHMGDCWWPGTISCFYHGWTYDENGEVVAVLSEGPECKIPGQVKLKVYPPRTLHGLVWLWLGDRDPAPIEEDVPPEFFDEKALILGTMTYWDHCNWRQAIENNADSHFGYLHRDCIRQGRLPVRPGRTRMERPEVINGRTLNRRRLPGIFAERVSDGGSKIEYQQTFPALGQKWPRHRTRLAWTWLFSFLLEKRTAKRTLWYADPEWSTGSQHLPGMVRNYHPGYYYTREIIPVGKDRTRLFYWHSSKPSNWLGRAWGKLYFYAWRNWMINYNISGQHGKANTYLYYNTPEYLSATDLQTVEWRKLILKARGMNGQVPAEPKGDAPVMPETRVPV